MKIINIDPEILSGTPVFNGTRVPVKNLFDSFECGENLEDFLDGFPSVNHEQVVGLLQLVQRMVSVSALMFDEKFAFDERGGS